MSRGEVLPSASKTSVHEDIIREVEETDWSVDPTEENDGYVCKGASATTEEADVSNGDGDAEKDDFNFNVDELECVDEEVEEDRQEDRVEDLYKTEKHTSEISRRRSNAHDRHRHHPYSRKDRGFRYEITTPGTQRRSSSFLYGFRADEQRLSTKFERKTHRKEVRKSSYTRTANDRDDKNIPLEELELEEVDCYDVDDCECVGDASVAGDIVFINDGDHNDNIKCSKIHDVSKIEDDFLDLCEDIDVEAMRRAAATNIVVYKDKYESPGISSRTRRNLNVYETLLRGDMEDRKNRTSSKYNGTAIESIRRDDGRFKRSSISYKRITKHGVVIIITCLEKDKPSTSSQNCSLRKSVGCNLEIISVDGPLVQGWCSNDNDKSGSCGNLKSSRIEKELSPSLSQLGLQQKNGTAFDVIEKIPSLLDMCIKGPKKLETLQTIASDNDNTARICFPLMDEGSKRRRYDDNKMEYSNETVRSPSLLRFEISAPNRKVMRQYAISLNKRELTKRPVEERSGIEKEAGVTNDLGTVPTPKNECLHKS
ncbi:hypothetical protein DICVIV_09581 [Dictyocaulus viviparus]|uniref:Uncharacterized protein n=1 Tax=Dictyocaulus viviparus TaxID=29172 RepID=A0A0D8XIH3_DICVI|nr:hypothetical protein DICVIV_09581 [Dictyocaulus viviparus]